MRTIVIVGAVVLAGATIIGFMMNERNKDSQPSFSNQGIPQMPSDAARSNSVDASGNPMLNPAHGQPGHRCDLAVGAPLTGNPAANASAAAAATSAPVTATSTQAAPAGVALNPAHGQPGHRCDISVGAPLNSAPKSGTATQNSSVQASTPAPKVSSSQAAPAGLKTNPAHGQPGHRCDLAVGAPLTASATDSIK